MNGSPGSQDSFCLVRSTLRSHSSSMQTHVSWICSFRYCPQNPLRSVAEPWISRFRSRYFLYTCSLLHNWRWWIIDVSGSIDIVNYLVNQQSHGNRMLLPVLNIRSQDNLICSDWSAGIQKTDYISLVITLPFWCKYLDRNKRLQCPITSWWWRQETSPECQHLSIWNNVDPCLQIDESILQLYMAGKCTVVVVEATDKVICDSAEHKPFALLDAVLFLPSFLVL